MLSDVYGIVIFTNSQPGNDIVRYCAQVKEDRNHVTLESIIAYLIIVIFEQAVQVFDMWTNVSETSHVARNELDVVIWIILQLSCRSLATLQSI